MEVTAQLDAFRDRPIFFSRVSDPCRVSRREKNTRNPQHALFQLDYFPRVDSLTATV